MANVFIEAEWATTAFLNALRSEAMISPMLMKPDGLAGVVDTGNFLAPVVTWACQATWDLFVQWAESMKVAMTDGKLWEYQRTDGELKPTNSGPAIGELNWSSDCCSWRGELDFDVIVYGAGREEQHIVAEPTVVAVTKKPAGYSMPDFVFGRRLLTEGVWLLTTDNLGIWDSQFVPNQLACLTWRGKVITPLKELARKLDPTKVDQSHCYWCNSSGFMGLKSCSLCGRKLCTSCRRKVHKTDDFFCPDLCLSLPCPDLGG
eukprot:TRINITY_DN51652_c0_g1_i2.p1 TRINITY_DN51652_c0_g1~~TRINITY_DN51652_c0_g1_i2.p1  ORF type:complete len:261 (-),score=29.26 TRINITY_DN51652_c0_g1_i2:106-888(-)